MLSSTSNYSGTFTILLCGLFHQHDDPEQIPKKLFQSSQVCFIGSKLKIHSGEAKFILFSNINKLNDIITISK